MISNFHTHTIFCDGEGTPYEYVAKAIEKGFTSIGFSSHAFLPFNTSWTMDEELMTNYFKTINEMKKLHSDKIDIYVGLEIDYFEDDDRDIFNKYDLDYNIGSVHFFYDKETNKRYTVDGSLSKFQITLNEYFNGDIKLFVKSYYEAIIKMIKNNKVDIIGHLDLIKKNNAHNQFFDENASWYKEIVLECLNEIAKTDCIVEVNTGGISRGYRDDVYPSRFILEECLIRDIKVMLNSDSHHPNKIDTYYEEARQLLREVGYKEIYLMYNHKWISTKL